MAPSAIPAPRPFYEIEPLNAPKTAPKSLSLSASTKNATQSPAPWDTHVHIFSPTTYPYSPSRAYSPAAAPLPSLLSFSSSLPLSSTPTNLVLVQPSPYGTDNSLILDVLRAQKLYAGTERRFRAIVVLDPEAVEEGELRGLHGLGVRGVRINLEAAGDRTDVGALKRRIGRIAEVIVAAGLGEKWLMQLFVSGKLWDDLYQIIRSLPVRIIADHQGGMKGSSSLPQSSSILAQPGLASLVSLAKSGHVYIKISGLYRSSALNLQEHEDMEDLVTYFSEQIPGRLVWGSDWPHTGSGEDRKSREVKRERGHGVTEEAVEGFRSVDMGTMVSNVRSWVGEEVWWKMIAETPTKLFA